MKTRKSFLGKTYLTNDNQNVQAKGIAPEKQKPSVEPPEENNAHSPADIEKKYKILKTSAITVLTKLESLEAEHVALQEQMKKENVQNREQLTTKLKENHATRMELESQLATERAQNHEQSRLLEQSQITLNRLKQELADLKRVNSTSIVAIPAKKPSVVYGSKRTEADINDKKSFMQLVTRFNELMPQTLDETDITIVDHKNGESISHILTYHVAPSHCPCCSMEWNTVSFMQ